MVYTSDPEEQSRLRQMLHDSSEQPKYYPGNFAMQPPAFAVGHPPVLSTDWPPYGLSMSNAAASIEPKDWPLRGPSVNHAAASNEPKDWPLYSPSMIHASASIGPKDGLLHGPSMNHAAAYLDPNWTMYTTTGNPVVDNSYQSSMRSSSTMQYRATGTRIEDHLSPGQTTVRVQSSVPSLSAQETTTPPNEHNMQFSSTMRYRATEVGTEDYLSPGRTSSHTRSSASSPSTPETTTRPNENNFEVVDVEAISAHGDLHQQDESDGHTCGWTGCTRHGTFSSPASLMRHIKVQHVAHRSVRCPECGQAFGRVDNMKEHRGRRHRVFD